MKSESPETSTRWVRALCPICGLRSPVCDQLEDVQRQVMSQWYANHFISFHKPLPIIELAEEPT